MLLLHLVLAHLHDLVDTLAESLGAGTCLFLQLPHHLSYLLAMRAFVLLDVATLLLQLVP